MATIKPGITRVGDTWSIRVQVQTAGVIRDKKRRVTGITLAEALRIQAEMRLAATPLEGTNPTFRSYYDTWLQHLQDTARARPSTLRIKRVIADRLLLPHFGDMLFAEITRAQVMRWQAWLGEQRDRNGRAYSRDYLASAWRDLVALFRSARDLLNLSTNPVEGMRFSAHGQPPKAKDALTQDEVIRLLAATEAESPDMRAMIWVAVTTGMRFGELTALTWTDVDLAARVISITKSQVEGEVGATKTSRNRIAPIHPDVVTVLQKHRDNPPRVQNLHNLVFPSKAGGYRYPSCLAKPLAACCARAGITKHISAHSLRRTCNNIVRMQLGDVAARAALGHVSASQTARYSVVEAEELQRGQSLAFGSLAGISMETERNRQRK